MLGIEQHFSLFLLFHFQNNGGYSKNSLIEFCWHLSTFASLDSWPTTLKQWFYSKGLTIWRRKHNSLAEIECMRYWLSVPAVPMAFIETCGKRVFWPLYPGVFTTIASKWGPSQQNMIPYILSIYIYIWIIIYIIIYREIFYPYLYDTISCRNGYELISAGSERGGKAGMEVPLGTTSAKVSG